jgi:hypothetical protein
LISQNSDAAACSRRAAWRHDRHRNDAGPETTKEGDDEIQSGREHKERAVTFAQAPRQMQGDDSSGASMKLGKGRADVAGAAASTPAS